HGVEAKGMGLLAQAFPKSGAAKRTRSHGLQPLIARYVVGAHRRHAAEASRGFSCAGCLAGRTRAAIAPALSPGWGPEVAGTGRRGIRCRSGIRPSTTSGRSD